MRSSVKVQYRLQQLLVINGLAVATLARTAYKSTVFENDLGVGTKAIELGYSDTTSRDLSSNAGDFIVSGMGLCHVRR